MTEEEEQIAFNQWVKDWGGNFPNMSRKALYQVYRSMDEENRLEFLQEAKGAINENSMLCRTDRKRTTTSLS